MTLILPDLAGNLKRLTEAGYTLSFVPGIRDGKQSLQMLAEKDGKRSGLCIKYKDNDIDYKLFEWWLSEGVDALHSHLLKRRRINPPEEIASISSVEDLPI